MTTNTTKQNLFINFQVLLTVKQASKILYLKPSTIYEHVKQGVIPAYKIGCKILFKEQDLFNFIECSKISILNNNSNIINTKIVRTKIDNNNQPTKVDISYNKILQKLSAI